MVFRLKCLEWFCRLFWASFFHHINIFQPIYSIYIVWLMSLLLKWTLNWVAGYAAYYFAMYFTHSMKLSIHIGRKPGKTFCVQKIYRILKCISTQKFIIRFFPFEDIQSSEIGDIPQVTKENCAISINCSFFAYL